MGNGSGIILDDGRSLWDHFVAEATVLFENRGRTAEEALAFCKAFDLAIDGGCGNILWYLFDPFDDEVVESLEIWAGLIETVQTVSLLQEAGLRPLLDCDLDLVEVGGGEAVLTPFRGVRDPFIVVPFRNHDDFVVVDGYGETTSLAKWIQTSGLAPVDEDHLEEVMA
jgi:hypothetical protein